MSAVAAENCTNSTRHRRDRGIVLEARSLSLGVSIFLLAVGAILTFAVEANASGFSINTVGIILMAAGALGLVLSLLFWSSFSPYRRGAVVGQDTVVEERSIHRDIP
jgi:small-conductance mechanosensitive channel